MFYTRKGDDGKTELWGCNQKISKSSAISEALGTIDEANSFLGFAKIKSKEVGLRLGEKGKYFFEVIHDVQKNLFIIQAELAGAPMTIGNEKVLEMEKIINVVEKELPPIHSFFISGGVELAAIFDFSRTLARRAERRVVLVSEEGGVKIGKSTLKYLNRLSSLLYALARLSNHKFGITEESPTYK